MLWAVKEHRESGWLQTKEPLNNRCSDSGESFVDNNYLLLKVHGNWLIAYNTILSLHDTHLSFYWCYFQSVDMDDHCTLLIKERVKVNVHSEYWWCWVIFVYSFRENIKQFLLHIPRSEKVYYDWAVSGVVRCEIPWA